MNNWLIPFALFFWTVAVHADESADKKRGEAIAEIKQVIDQVGPEKRAQLVFRLAELYYQQHLVDEAIQYYREVVDNYPDFLERERALFSLTSIMLETKKKAEAREYLVKLVSEYPDSKYAADAYLALADYNFSESNLVGATANYQAAYERGKSLQRPSIYVYALYKLAWCHYNERAFNKALEEFKQVVAFEEQAGTKAQFKREALIDLARVYADLEQVKEAHVYFLAHTNPKDALDLTHRLADLYAARGDSAHEIEALNLLTSSDSAHSDLPTTYAKLMGAYLKAGQTDFAIVSAHKIADSCKNNPTVDSCERAEQDLRKLATQAHQQADKQLAKQLYDAYLSGFPNHAEAKRVQLFRADVLFDLGDWLAAAQAYDSFVIQNRSHELARQAAANAVVAWKKKLAKTTPTGLQLTQEEQAFVNSCDRYVGLLTDKQMKSETLFAAAHLFFQHHLYADAEKRFKAVLVVDPQSAFAAASLYNLMQVYEASDRVDAAIGAGERLYGKHRPSPYDADVVASLAKLNELKKNREQAAHWYEVFVNEFASDARIPNMLYNAAFLYSAIDLAKAISLYERYLRDFPKRADAREVRLRLAKAWQKTGRIEDAINSCKRVLREDRPIKNEQGQGFCKFWILEPERLAYQKIIFKGGIAQLRKQIRKKRVVMAELVSRYLDVVKAKDTEWGIAALYRAADVQLDFARALRQIPSPPGLDSAGKRAFQAGLEDMVLPVQEDAIVVLNRALEKARSLGITSSYVADIERTLKAVK